jgi:uncharacterized protein YceK
MARKVLAGCMLVVASLAATGCGTMANMPNDPDPQQENVMRVYGGVRCDAEWLQQGVETLRKGEADEFAIVRRVACLAGICALDIPLSFIADTLTLPVTIPAVFEKTASPEAAPVRDAP